MEMAGGCVVMGCQGSIHVYCADGTMGFGAPHSSIRIEACEAGEVRVVTRYEAPA